MTLRAHGTRDECEGLDEVDEYATKANAHKMEKNDVLIFNVTRTGSTYTQATAYNAGQVGYLRCTPCNAENVNVDRFWYCESMKGLRK